MSLETITAVEFLSHTGILVQTIARNLRDNRLDRKTLQTHLLEYAARAEYDGRLINASRQDSRCVEHGLFLAYVHVELITWLARFNYTIPATSVKWYSWKKLLTKYRLPLFSVSSQTAELRGQLENIKAKADLVQADLGINNVDVPATSINYRKVQGSLPAGAGPEELHDLLRRGLLAQRQLTWSSE
ncbi:hypothetical protein ETB97_011206 [Aspergillus alliaceus]|uniref:Glyoxalase family protein n=1 Tax=Petromyces alliaceus TaxID=209559 RepID=A0A8H6E7Y4_PETAA|nr:hypothetical protein ETB97_011206 [Aspergillus burnettii]